jgi:hypothetical protein
MTPYSATDLLRSMRTAYGIPEEVEIPFELPDRRTHLGRVHAWITRVFRRNS